MKSEHAAIRAEISELRESSQTARSMVKQFEQSIDQRVEDLRRQLGESLIARVEAEVSGLRTEVESATRKIESIPAATAQFDLDAERAHWQKEIDGRMENNLRKLGSEIREELRNSLGNKVGNETFQSEWA